MIRSVLHPLMSGILVLAIGCATAPQTKPGAKRTAHQQRPIDAKTQQFYYDRGLKYYSAEDYVNAKEAFEEAVDYGPNTPLGLKAKENLKKIGQILKTVEELESK